MKYIKMYEEYSDIDFSKPKVNDFVLCDIKWENWLPTLDTYIKNSVGQIINIEKTYSKISASVINERYIIKYEKSLTSFGYNQKQLNASKTDIIMYSEKKEEILNHIELLKQKDIYNL